jgi:hypothetical protein
MENESGNAEIAHEQGRQKSAAELAAIKQEIIDKLDVKNFYISKMQDQTVSFKSDGWSHLVHCPIHKDTGKPNFSFNIKSGGFKCFACGAKGSIFDFWSMINMKDPKSSFSEAFITLANEANVNINQSRKTEINSPVDSKNVSTGKTQAGSTAGEYTKLNKAQAANNSIPPIPRQRVEDLEKNLNPEHYKYLAFSRGLTIDTIKRYNICFDTEIKFKNNDSRWVKGKYCIPIVCENNLVRNLRVYSPEAQKEYKMINTKGYGSPARIFPLHELVSLKWETLIYCEGEWDCILLNQKLKEAGLNGEFGIGAITNTAGCNTFEREWLEYFVDKNFIFMFDVDPPGKTWAASHATTFFLTPLSTGKIKSLKIVSLPLDGTKEYKDVTDFFIKLGGTTSDLLKIIEDTPQAKISSHSEVVESSKEDAKEDSSVEKVSTGTDLAVLDKTHSEITIEPIDVNNFVECIKNRQYIDQRVRVMLTISGECTKIYHATRSLRVIGCPLMNDDNCCSASAGIQTIPYGDVSFIECCMSSKKQLMSNLQSIACTKGKQCTIEEVEKVVMQEFFAHQVVKRLTAREDESGRMINSQQLVTSSVYVLQPETHIEIGPHDYMAVGYVRSHPQTRNATLFVEHMEAMEDDWKKFSINEETIEHLKFINSYKNVKELLDDITNGVTKIYESNDILLAVLLTYLSPLWFSFNGTLMRGWINSCILGDSGTGKSATYARVSDWLNLGDLFSALSGSRTGLLYSIKQRGVEWYVQIGRYVTASGKIIAVDETQEMTAEEIKKMAKAMDEGWLDVSQVASGGYRTCTRCIFLLNPKPPKKMSDFAYGCQAMAECFDPMFIRRIDIAVFTTGKEDIGFYNKIEDKNINPRITSDAFRSLVYWAWTREADNIIWEEEATQECLEKAIDLSLIFGNADDIPLVNPQDFRNNLARLSTAFAILSGSFSDDYESVVVKKNHVMSMAKFIDICYSSSSCNLRQYSKNCGKKKSLKDYENIVETFTKITKHASNSPDRRWSEGKHFLQMILLLQQQQYIRKRDLSEQLGVSPNWVQKHVSILQMYSLIELSGGGYRTTPKFNKFMRQWQDDPEVDQMLEQVSEIVGKNAMAASSEEYQQSFYGSQQEDPFNS